MLNPRLCERCNQRAPTTFITYRRGDQEVKVAFCELCYQGEPPQYLIDAKFAALPPPTPKPKKTNIFVVLEIHDYDAHEGIRRTPIAAFISETNAHKFIERQTGEEVPDRDLRVISLPLEDLNAK